MVKEHFMMGFRFIHSFSENKRFKDIIMMPINLLFKFEKKKKQQLVKH